MKRAIKLYLLNLLLWLDGTIVVWIGFDQRLTISAVLAIYGRAGDCKVCEWLCKALDKIDPRHCEESIINWSNYRPYDKSIWKLPE